MSESIRNFLMGSKGKLLLQIVSGIILLLVLHNRWVVPRISFDQLRQMVALHNWMGGNDITFQLLEPGMTVVRDGAFPTGYYFLLAPFYHLFGDVILLHRVFELVGFGLAFYQVWKIGRLIDVRFELKHIAYFVFIFSAIQLNPWRAMGFTDVWSLFFFLIAMRMAWEAKSKDFIKIGLVVLFCFCSVWMRYSYYLLAFVPVGLLVLKFGVRKFGSYVPTFVLLFLIVLANVLHGLYFGEANHLEASKPAGRWFIKHVIQMDPTSFNAFFSDHVLFGGMGLERWGENTNWPLRLLILFASIGMLMYLAFLTYKKYKRDVLLMKSEQGIILIGIWSSVLAIIVFITGVSVYYPSKEINFIYTWSLISRYFAPSYVFLQTLIVLLLYFGVKGAFSNLVLKGILICSLLFQFGYLISFEVRFSPTDTWGNYEQFYNRNEMKVVMKNYEFILKGGSDSLDWTESQDNYAYKSIYYLVADNEGFLLDDRYN